MAYNPGTWIASASPYNVVGNITISAGQSLVIEAGVEVNFQGNYKIIVQGGLDAIGAEGNVIYFTTDNQAIGWGGIHFDNTSILSHFSFCRFEYGKANGDNYPDFHGGAVRLISSNAEFSNCIFADNDAYANEGILDVKIINLLGEQVFSQVAIANNYVQLNLSNLENGIYLLQIMTAYHTTEIHKIVLTK